MTLTNKINNELDACKADILRIEKLVENAQTKVEIARDCENDKDVNFFQNLINIGLEEVKNIVSIQAQSMKLDYNTMLDLIFDREYTLTKI